MVGFSPRSDWVDLPSTSTPIFAADLLRYENGIANLDAHFLPCDLATTAAITLSGTGQTIDGFTVTAGMRIFNKDDATATNRGIYIAGAGTWARSSDMANGATFRSGSTVVIRAGSANGGTIWSVAKSGSTTGAIGTDSLTITALTKRVQNNGTGVTIRPVLNFINGLSATDNSANNSTDIGFDYPSEVWSTPTFDTSGTPHVAQIPAAKGQYSWVLDQAYVIGMLDGSTSQFFEIHLCLIQDATGGRALTFPGGIHWHGIPIDGTGQPQFSSAPNSITYIKCVWLGSTGGYLGLAG